ncbi:MAG: DUF362 domain-containing protein [Syntrophales bacterium]|jgi:hypothetical protein|nr:DUF362 domain-containing protein [Syntrophales bacterium]
MQLPEMSLCRQKFSREAITNPATAIAEVIRPSWLPGKIKSGQTVAITGGSRGIAAIDVLMRALVGSIKEIGAKPFVVNAMGSHGGATAKGQLAILESLGITESSVGCPVIVSMDVDIMGELGDGFPVFCDRNAAGADHIIVMNRIKAHTAVTGPVQSGLCKMCAIGLGKINGASRLHRYGLSRMGEMIPAVASFLATHAPIVAGIGIVENAYGEIARLELVHPEDFPAADARLLEEASHLKAGLPVSELDLLVVEEMGKKYSGTGMDPNVIGRWRIAGEVEPRFPRIGRIVVLALEPSSQGNAQGVGLADLITERLFKDIDLAVTYKNTLTSTYLQRGMIPIIGGSDRETIDKALSTLSLLTEERTRIAWIKNTSHLEEIALSAGALAQYDAEWKNNVQNAKLETIGKSEWKFDDKGTLMPWD